MWFCGVMDFSTQQVPVRTVSSLTDLDHNSPRVDCVWNVMAHAQKTYFVFPRNGRVRLNRRGRQFSRLLAAEVCAPALVMLDTPCSEVVWRVLATHSIRQFRLHFPSRVSPCAITFQLESTFCVNHCAVTYWKQFLTCDTFILITIFCYSTVYFIQTVCDI